ncbi:hypothetical protein DSO06_01425 [Candidatus Nezhaarchaeota archaeon WYZ-LMO8]|nr:MAG: hypothetical protein DSO06_01425 [Candidatus Nezhaarchaeota archaeon WYZ-LMO8]TDA36708.1 MAG: hypothetical protein DSO05_02805 [Candidatus Nezhaarchaeota archaeon WYZ-LMO7]
MIARQWFKVKIKNKSVASVFMNVPIILSNMLATYPSYTRAELEERIRIWRLRPHSPFHTK